MKNSCKQLHKIDHAIPSVLCNSDLMCLLLMNGNTQCSGRNKKHVLKKNEIIVDPNKPFNTLFIIHSGSLKRFLLSKNKQRQITGFYLPGDILGFEGINEKRYYNYVQVLTETRVCELQYTLFQDLINRYAAVRNLALNLMSEEILRQQQLILMLSKRKAEERLAMFIYSLYQRYARGGQTSHNIKLCMGRHDIANYLGLTIETISRIFTRMHRQDILHVKGKQIFINDLSELRKFSEAFE